MSQGLNKSDLVSLMSKLGSVSKADAERALNLVTESINNALGSGKSVNLVGFGSFHVKNRKARTGRNPRTGESIQIKSYNQPLFRAGKKMKDCCN